MYIQHRRTYSSIKLDFSTLSCVINIHSTKNTKKIIYLIQFAKELLNKLKLFYMSINKKP